MRAVRPYPYACERAREFVSLRLDGQLSELEGALLDAHLARCAGCAAFAPDVEEVTALLRAAPLERLEHATEIPSRRRAVSWRQLQVGVAAGVAAVASLTAFGVGGAYNRADREAAVVTSFGSAASVRYEISLISEPGDGGPDLPL